jgi:hypothetical protein
MIHSSRSHLRAVTVYLEDVYCSLVLMGVLSSLSPVKEIILRNMSVKVLVSLKLRVHFVNYIEIIFM